VTRELSGDPNGEGLRIGIVVADFNNFVTAKLLEGAKSALVHHGVADNDIIVVRVPGSFEIPVVAHKMAASDRFDAIVCIGAVIRGETDHYEHVAGEAARGIANASATTGKPVVFGVLTTDTVEQAMNRAGGKQGNSGYTAAVTAVIMVNLLRNIDAG